MSFEKIGRYKPGQNVTVKPNGELAGDQLKAGRFVTITGYDEATRTYLADHSAAGEQHPFGVTQRESAKPNVEDPRSVDLLVEVQKGGIPFVEAGEEIAAPTNIAVGEDGKAFALDAAVAASVDAGVVGENNAITYTAKAAGVAGNAISVTLTDPPGNNVALSVDVDGTDIEVTLATDGASAITSTAAQVIAAIKEHDVASQLITAANKGASSGAGVVKALAKTSLSGGLAGSTGDAVGRALTSADAAGDYIEVDLF